MELNEMGVFWFLMTMALLGFYILEWEFVGGVFLSGAVVKLLIHTYNKAKGKYE